jgi:hypothetical protein
MAALGCAEPQSGGSVSMIAANIRKIAKQLATEAEEPVLDREVVQTAVRRLISQAEMLEEGLDTPEQVAA